MTRRPSLCYREGEGRRRGGADRRHVGAPGASAARSPCDGRHAAIGRLRISASITTALAGAVTAVISALGYAGIAFLMGLESACIPIPSEIIMPFSGYLVSTGRFDLVAVATAGAVGCNIGSTAAYAVGAYGGRPLVERWGDYILLSRSELDRMDRFFQRYGAITVLIGRLLPVVRTFISLPAGIARMPFWKFQVYTFIGSWPWCFALAYIGLRLGRAWDSNPQLKNVMHSLDVVLVAALVLAAGWYFWRLRARRATRKHERRRDEP